MPPMPDGYTLFVEDPGRGWHSWGWVYKENGRTMKVRRALGKVENAAADAWKDSSLADS